MNVIKKLFILLFLGILSFSACAPQQKVLKIKKIESICNGKLYAIDSTINDFKDTTYYTDCTKNFPSTCFVIISDNNLYHNDILEFKGTTFFIEGRLDKNVFIGKVNDCNVTVKLRGNGNNKYKTCLSKEYEKFNIINYPYHLKYVGKDSTKLMNNLNKEKSIKWHQRNGYKKRFIGWKKVLSNRDKKLEEYFTKHLVENKLGNASWRKIQKYRNKASIWREYEKEDF